LRPAEKFTAASASGILAAHRFFFGGGGAMAHAVFDWRQWLDSAAESRIFYLTIETHQEMIEIVKRDFSV